MKDANFTSKPTLEQLRNELNNEKNKKEYRRSVGSSVAILFVVAAISVLLSMLLVPILKIYGTSMQPTLNENEYVVTLSAGRVERGDTVAFYYGNRILIKRCIAYAGDTVDIAEDGTVSVNGIELDEPYVQNPAFGDCDIELPCKVPQEHYFLMGDNREESVDSRSTAIGCVSEEQIMGRVLFRIWPLSRIGKIG